MDDTKTLKDQQITYTEDIINNLNQKTLPQISLPNQDGNLLKLNRHDTFRLVIYFYSLTGNPQKKLPKDWNKIPGASGCTLQNSIYRDNYDNRDEYGHNYSIMSQISFKLTPKEIEALASYMQALY